VFVDVIPGPGMLGWHACDAKSRRCSWKIKYLGEVSLVHCEGAMKPRAAVTSLALHFSGALLLFFLASFTSSTSPRKSEPVTSVLLRAPRLLVSRPRSGGGDRSALPAQRGRAPEVHRQKIFLPPTAVIRNEQPRLLLEQALLNAPDFNIDAANVGDPNGRGSRPSGGTGGPAGLGEGLGFNVGAYSGPSGSGGSSKERVKITRPPQVVYKVEPEYSEEARKVKYQGSVVLAIEVDVTGSATNLRVVRSAGLGLDEKAMDAVRQWRFRPGLSGDRPVAAPALVEVSFHLL
jgi:periplasmic protein TonB